MSKVIGCVICECDIEGMHHAPDCQNHPDNLERPDAAPPKTADQIRQGLREADRCPFCNVDELHWPGLRTALDAHPEDAPEGPWSVRYALNREVRDRLKGDKE